MQLGLAAEVRRVSGYHDHAVARGPFDKLIGAAANGLGGGVNFATGNGRWHDLAIGGQDFHQQRKGAIGLDLNGQRINDDHFCDLFQLSGINIFDIGVFEAGEAVAHMVAAELFAVVEIDFVAQLEFPGRFVGRTPRFRQARGSWSCRGRGRPIGHTWPTSCLWTRQRW